MSTLQNTISMMQTLPETDLIKIQNFTKKLSRVASGLKLCEDPRLHSLGYRTYLRKL